MPRSTPFARRLRRSIGVGLVLALAPVWWHPSPLTAHAQTPPLPNVLIIVTDDQRLDGTLAVMPKTRRWMQAGGRTFTNGFTSSPICCPARSSILTGRYVHNHGVLTNHDGSLLDHTTTIERYLGDAGYENAIVGKFLNEWPLGQAPPYFDRWSICSPCSEGGYFGRDFDVDGTIQTVADYATDFMATRSLEYLRAFEADDDRPWFLYVATGAPHDPFTVEPQYLDASVPAWNGNPAVSESDRSDKPPYVRAKNGGLAHAKDVRSRQLRTLRSVDDLVDDILRELGALSERRRTLIFFVSDNGFLWNEHKLGVGKTYPYQQSIRVPMLVRWQNRVPAGTSDARLASLVDVAPTVLGAAGIPPDPSVPMDGRSLLTPPTRTRLLIEYFLNAMAPSTPAWAALRTPTSQYTEYYAEDGLTVVFREYYDLVADPWELRNLLGDADPSNDPEAAGLSAQLAADRGCSGATCP
jgi:arylsulfatase A-like enzyme